MKTVAFVPIKLNNERLPGKNILPLEGKPLCRHLLDTLVTVNEIDEIYVFCSDPSIAEYLPRGVRFLKRETELDSFQAKHYDIVRSFFGKVRADVYVNAHVTNPFLPASLFEDGLAKILHEGYDSALAVTEIREHLWRKGEPFNFTKEDPPRTQDLVPLYAEVGVFMYLREVFENTGTRYGQKTHLIPVDRLDALDINYQEDFDLARAVAKMRAESTQS